MTEDDVKEIVEKELKGFKYEAPEEGTTVGVPWSEERISSCLPKLKAALVEPHTVRMRLAETYEQMKSESEEYATYWVVAEEDPYFEWYDPVTDELGLALRSATKEDEVISIGVRGDLVGVYCAM